MNVELKLFLAISCYRNISRMVWLWSWNSVWSSSVHRTSRCNFSDRLFVYLCQNKFLISLEWKDLKIQNLYKCYFQAELDTRIFNLLSYISKVMKWFKVFNISKRILVTRHLQNGRTKRLEILYKGYFNAELNTRKFWFGIFNSFVHTSVSKQILPIKISSEKWGLETWNVQRLRVCCDEYTKGFVRISLSAGLSDCLTKIPYDHDISRKVWIIYLKFGARPTQEKYNSGLWFWRMS